MVNAAAPADLAVLTHALNTIERAGRRYLFRTAADFVASISGIAPRRLLTAAELVSPDLRTGGLLVAGSYVEKTPNSFASFSNVILSSNALNFWLKT